MYATKQVEFLVFPVEIDVCLQIAVMGRAFDTDQRFAYGRCKRAQQLC